MGVEAKPVNIQSAPVASSHSVSRESSLQARLEAIDSCLFNSKAQSEPARRLIARLSGVSTMRDVCTVDKCYHLRSSFFQLTGMWVNQTTRLVVGAS